jgi:hypothetical protein
MNAVNPALAEAAQHEIDLRARQYPLLVANSKLSADEATIDFQAWHVIRDYLGTGAYKPVDAGGVDGLTVVDWLLAEAAGDRAVATADAALGQARADPQQDDAKIARRSARVEQTKAIAGIVRRQRAAIESLNRQLQQRAAAGKAKEAA